MDRDVDDEADHAIVLGSVRNVERFGDPQIVAQFEFGDLRVRQEREFARDLLRKERRVVAGPVRDLVRAEDNLIGIGIPQAADAALRRRGREGLEVAQRESERRLRFGQHVRAELPTLRVIPCVHAVRYAHVVNAASHQGRPGA
jgi:hypothetical protein